MRGQLGDKFVLVGQKWRMRSLGEFMQGGIGQRGLQPAACAYRGNGIPHAVKQRHRTADLPGQCTGVGVQQQLQRRQQALRTAMGKQLLTHGFDRVACRRGSHHLQGQKALQRLLECAIQAGTHRFDGGTLLGMRPGVVAHEARAVATSARLFTLSG